MDGHDNKDDGARDGSAAQGIFSTPELTVDTEKITQQNNSAKEKNRVASIFANTDAGRQAQNINDAMVTSSAPATEDIVIRNEPKKRGKVLVIVAIVILLAAVGGGVGWLILNNITSNSADARSAYKEYYSFMKDGPDPEDASEEDADSGEEYFLLNVADSGMTSEEMNQYTTNLLTKYDKYSSINVPQDILDKNATYRSALDTAIKGQSLDIISQNLLEKVSSSGTVPAQDYINEVAPEADEEKIIISPTDNMILYIREYLSTQLTLFGIYKSFGCMEGSQIDYDCQPDAIASSTSFQSVSQKLADIKLAISYYQPVFNEFFIEESNALLSELEKINE